MLGVAKETVLRIIEETGTALGDYMSREFRDLPCERVAMDECWSYVFKHGHVGQKTLIREEGKGDYWLWCAIDPDTKLVFSHHIGRRDGVACNTFVEDMTSRVTGPAQYASDQFFMYENPMRRFGRDQAGTSYGLETKHFLDPARPEVAVRTRRNRPGLMVKSTRESIFGQANLSLLTTAHVERVFLSVRQEVARFTRLTLAYSKKLEMHKASVALYFGVYNLVRRHKGLANFTPAMAAGLASKRWTLLDVVQMADAYWKPIYAERAAKKAAAKRIEDDAVFLKAMAEAEVAGP